MGDKSPKNTEKQKKNAEKKHKSKAVAKTASPSTSPSDK
jgi:hypothetical protein